MLNSLSQLDTNLFFLINHLPHNFVFDYFFGAFSFIGEYGIIWFLLTFLFSLKYQPQKRWSFVARIYAAGFFSLLLVFVLKELFGRVRPEFVLQNVILPFGPDSSFSFPSGHALTSFVFAFLLAKQNRHPEIFSGSVLKRMLKRVQHDKQTEYVCISKAWISELRITLLVFLPSFLIHRGY